MGIKLCKDCINSVCNLYCLKSEDVEISPFDDKIILTKAGRLKYCSEQRSYGKIMSYLVGVCGVEGRFYIEKD